MRAVKAAPSFRGRGSGRRPFLLAAILLLSALSAPGPSRAATIVLDVLLNGERKGEFFVGAGADGDFLLRADDWRALGLGAPRAPTVLLDGEPHVSLRSVPGVSFRLDEKTLTLEIGVPPSFLPKRTLDFLPPRRPRTLYPKDDSAFLNYRLGYTSGDAFAFREFDATGQAGARFRDLLFLTDASYTKTPDDGRFRRLLSSVTHDRRRELQRIVVGDFFAATGDLGSSLTLGGLSVSKVYRIDPYFIGYPLADVSGLLSLPSDVDVYVDGMRIRREKLPPGEFELTNLSHYGGAAVVTVVIKDPFGNEHRIERPFYFTDALLARGLHEYSYNVGAVREGFGEPGDRYAGMAASAFHDYGVSDRLTLGVRGEGAGSRWNLGPRATFRLLDAGVVTASLAGSVRDGGRAGAAGLLSYQYQDRALSARMFVRGFSRDYATAAETAGGERTRFEIGAGAGYGTRKTGFFSVDATRLVSHGGGDRRTGAATWSRTLFASVSALLSFRRVSEGTSSDEFFAGLTFSPRPDATVSAGYRRAEGADLLTLQAQKNPPAGEGYGFRAFLERSDAPPDPVTTVSPSVEYHTRYGIYTGEYRGRFGGAGEDDETYRVSAAGGIVRVGGAFGATRPITDSFGLVTVGALEGVRVYQSNQEVGRTDAKGRIFVPNLGSYYENQVSIGDRDIPIDYAVSEVVKYVSPPLRSGSVIPFDVRKIQAVTGRVKVLADGATRPAEFVEVTARADGREIVFPTGRGGEFWIENVPAGAYRASFELGEKGCVFDVTIPAADEAIIDLGEVTCEQSR